MTKVKDFIASTPVTNREEFEAALDGHRLWLRENWNDGPRWYLVRRNGMTKTWKRSPLQWEIPIKWKLDKTMRVGDYNIGMLAKSLKAGPGPG